MSSKLVVACIQHACVDGRDANLATSGRAGARGRGGRGAAGAAAGAAQRAVFLPARGRGRDSTVAEADPGPEHRAPRRAGAASTAWCWSARCSSAARRACTTTPRWCSSATAASPGKLPQDAHPRRSGLLREVLLHARRSRLQPIDTSVGRLGVLVCWDQWYPEAARLMALAGAELLLYPTAIGWDPRDDAGREGTASAMPGSLMPARPRGRQRPAGAGLQPRRPRAVAARRSGRHPVLGQQLMCRPAGRVPRRGRRRTSRRC